MFKGDRGGVMPGNDNRSTNNATSKPQNTAVGSGSRPTGSKINIPTSAPDNARTLGRSAPGWLK